MDKTLLYLKVYIEEWIDKWPNVPTEFSRWRKRMRKASNKERVFNIRKYFSECIYCERDLYKGVILKTIDHLHPLVLGGTEDLGNRVPCCGDCNRWKGKLTLVQWKYVVQIARKEDRFPPYTRIQLDLILRNIELLIINPIVGREEIALGTCNIIKLKENSLLSRINKL